MASILFLFVVGRLCYRIIATDCCTEPEYSNPNKSQFGNTESASDDSCSWHCCSRLMALCLCIAVGLIPLYVGIDRLVEGKAYPYPPIKTECNVTERTSEDCL